MAPQNRPLVLLHKCTECATFALAPTLSIERKIMEIDQIRLTFSKALRLNTKECSKADFDDNEDSAYSSLSGQSSPEDSPVCRSDSPSPNGRPPLAAIADGESAASTGSPPSHPFRQRSVSVCGGETQNSPLKGILKRRPPFLRFLSQCEEENLDKPIMGSPSDTNSANNLSHDESTIELTDNDDCIRDQWQSSSKKTVRFNDRVQEKVFRPNSSILGQRKKNQRKQLRKRKRTDSGDSQNGGSEIENEHQDGKENGNEYEGIQIQGDVIHADWRLTGQEIQNEGQKNGKEIKNEDQENEHEKDDQQEKLKETQNENGKEEGDEEKEEADILRTYAYAGDLDIGDLNAQQIHKKKVDNQPDPHSANANPASRKQSERNVQKKRQRAAAVLNDPRYSGFVLGKAKQQRAKQVRRNSSGDSALADDEEEEEDLEGTNTDGKGVVVECGEECTADEGGN